MNERTDSDTKIVRHISNALGETCFINGIGDLENPYIIDPSSNLERGLFDAYIATLDTDRLKYDIGVYLRHDNL